MPNKLEYAIEQIAKEQVFSDKTLCRGCDRWTINPLSGGLINKIYITCNGRDECDSYVIMTFPSSKEKIEQEQFIRELLPDRSIVPFPKIYKTGTLIKNTEKEQEYMIREYVPGITLDEALSRNPEDADIQKVLYQLGRALSAFHGVKLPMFGKIIGNRVVGSPDGTWSSYELNKILGEINKIGQFPPDIAAGPYAVGRIQSLLPALAKIVADDATFLNHIIQPRLIHHDFHFLNIVVNGDTLLHLVAILDTDNITAGDPAIDLVSIESLLYLAATRYKNLFLRNAQFFTQGYLEKNQALPNYHQLRRLYHIAWSLSYFSAVFNMDTKIHPLSHQIRENMDSHYNILFGLSRGMSLSDIGIFPII